MASGAPHHDDDQQGTTGVGAWLEERLGISALRYAVPPHANTLWYTLGGITFVGVIVLAVTGVWLAQYYNPSQDGARESVLFLQNQAPLGNVIRGIHVWMAYLVVVTAALHLIRIFVTASYKIPREINWLVGLSLFGLLLFGGVFTGTILRWDQEAYEAMAHNVDAAGILGALGGYFSETFTTSVSILPRLYIAHVSMVPALLSLLLIFHFFLVKYHGISPTPAQADAGEAPRGKLPRDALTGRYTTHLLLMAGYGVALLGLAGVLGLAFPQPIGPAPDPTMEVTKPPFVFYWLYPFEDWLGVSGIVYGGAVFFGLLGVLPFLDRTPFRGPRRRPLATALGVVLLVVVLVLSIMTAVSPAAKHLG